MIQQLSRRRLSGYWQRLKFEWAQWHWRKYTRHCRVAFERWKNDFVASDSEVLVGAHLHLHGGVRNHLLAIRNFSRHRTALVPGETELQKYGSAPFAENVQEFLATPPPESSFCVHTHVLPLLIDWAAVHASGRLRWVHTHHLLYYPEAGRNGIEPWQEQLNEAMIRGARMSEICLCVSRWELKVLRDRFGVSAQYLPNGVDVSQCDEANATRFRRRFRLGGPFVLWVGRLDPVKNPRDFIRLATLVPAMQFVMIGGLTAENIRQEYSLDMPRNMHLLPQLPHRDVLDAVAACDVLVVTSFREGLPTLVLEAMALRRQIVIPNEPGCLDATDGPANAFVYRQGDIEDLQQKLDTALRHPQPREDARRRVLGEFDWRVVADRLDHVYRTGEVP